MSHSQRTENTFAAKHIDELINLCDFEEHARTRLSKQAYDYYSSGAWDEITVAWNQQAYREIALRPRVLVDVSNRCLSTCALGTPISMPVIIAPTAFHGLAHEQAELATVKAAHAVDTIMTLSSLANCSIEEVAEQNHSKLWFQLYVYKDTGITRHLVQRATEAGYRALVLTVDLPLMGRRERDVRNRFQLPEHLQIKSLATACLDRLPDGVSGSALVEYIATLYDSSLSWKTVEWLRSICPLPLLVKGVLRADDAARAIEYGAAGVIVSNHGGRQLDTAIATIKALPAIVTAVGDQGEVFVDGGIRRGTDILKALALGAKAVLVGRPVLWGLACGGEDGVAAMLNILRDELDLAMALAGCSTLEEITEDLVVAGRR